MAMILGARNREARGRVRYLGRRIVDITEVFSVLKEAAGIP